MSKLLREPYIIINIELYVFHIVKVRIIKSIFLRHIKDYLNYKHIGIRLLWIWQMYM